MKSNKSASTAKNLGSTPSLHAIKKPAPDVHAQSCNGAEILIKTLADLDVDTIFGYPGGAVLPVYDALFDNHDLNHILIRHEQAGSHAADGYARATGKPGEVLAK